MSKKRNIQVIGLTRWSYPFGSKGFRQSGRTLEEIRDRLYAPERLDHRLFLFEHVLLPGLRAQTDKDFKHLLLLGDQLPDPWLKRILELVQDIHQIVPLVLPEGAKHQNLCREIILEHVDRGCDVIAQHRLDDDDGIGVRFVKRTRSLFEHFSEIFDQSKNLTIDFSRGFILRSSLENITMNPVSMRFWAPGMAIYKHPDSKRALLDHHHLRVWHDMPTFMWPSEPMFIRGAHHDNDSNLATFARRTRGFKFNPDNQENYFKANFGIELPNIQTIWESKKSHFLGIS